MPTFATFLASHMGSRAMARMNPHQQLVALRDLLNDQGFNFQEDKEYTKFMSMDSSFRNDRKFVDDHHRLSLRLVGSDLDSPKVEVMKEKIRNGRVEKTYLGLFHIDTTKFIVSVIKRNASKRARSASSGSMAAKAPKSDYEVIVGNIGTVYRGTSFSAAQKDFATYREQSQSGYGRAGGESVTLMRDGEVIREFDGEAEAEGSMARNTITASELLGLQSEAKKNGDEALFALCTLALDGRTGLREAIFHSRSYAEYNLWKSKRTQASAYQECADLVAQARVDGEYEPAKKFIFHFGEDEDGDGSMDRVNKYEYLIVLQGYFRPGGWEDLFTVEKKGSGFDLDANREIKARLKEYRENDPRAYRLINRKTLRS